MPVGAEMSTSPMKLGKPNNLHKWNELGKVNSICHKFCVMEECFFVNLMKFIINKSVIYQSHKYLGIYRLVSE